MTVADQIYKLVATGDLDDALDILYDHVDELLRRGRFEECDNFIVALDPDRAGGTVLVGVLGITRCAADKLPNRPTVVARTAQAFRALPEDETEEILSGLR